jgi:hypothetical protein
MKISQRAFDLIVDFEVTSKAYYQQHYQHPEWPGGASGVTIAIGYDLGYASHAKITSDWSSRVSAPMLATMMTCAGVTGDAARNLLSRVRPLILVPWDTAIDVFQNIDLPQWTATVIAALPNADKLSPDCLGSLVMLAYNRGAGGFHSAKPRFAEMHHIYQHMAAQDFAAIPAEIIAMKRLWPNVAGLLRRRDEEAQLFRDGLNAPLA